jgi:very-short-patch-repair endonuclease
MTKIFNRTEEILKRRLLRNNMPQAEIILWSKLKGKGLGYKFRRQYSIGVFAVDFYCPAVKLAMEVDGDSHHSNGAEIRDEERQIIIESYGVNFLRFTNREIYENMDGVLLKIIQRITDLTSPGPSLPRRGFHLPKNAK